MFTYVGQPSTSCASKPSPGTGGSHGLLPVAMTSSSYWTLLDWAPRALQRTGRPQGTGDDLGMVNPTWFVSSIYNISMYSHIQSYTFIYIHIITSMMMNGMMSTYPLVINILVGIHGGLMGYVCIYIHNGGNLDPTRTYQDLPFQWDGI